MSVYFLSYYFKNSYKSIVSFIVVYYYSFLGLMAFIVAFGNLALAVYTKKNVALHTQIIHNLPFIAKIFLIHSWWIGVVLLTMIISNNIFTPPFARTKKHKMGKILMEVRFQRWKSLIQIIIGFFFGLFTFLVFGIALKMYAFGLCILLWCCWALHIMFYKSLTLTENGVWIKRTFFDVFIPYSELIPLSNRDIQEALDGKTIDIQYESDCKIAFSNHCKGRNQTRESFMKLYNQKINEIKTLKSKDTQCN